MKIGVELEFFICHKSDETFYMPDIISRYLKYNSGFISMQKDSNGICIKAKNELGVTISFEFTYSIIEFSIDPQYDILSLHSIINTAIYDFSLFIDHYELMLISHGIAPFNIILKDGWIPYHSIKIKKNTILHQLLDIEEYTVSSTHHQCIKKLGMNIVASAYSADGIVEAIELCSDKQKIIGFQGHIENILTNYTEYNKIIKYILS